MTHKVSPNLSTSVTSHHPLKDLVIGHSSAYFLSRYENRTQIDLKDFVEYVLKAKSEVNYDGTIDGWDQQWSTPNAILFTVSIMTIVGYGNISPKTVNAQGKK